METATGSRLLGEVVEMSLEDVLRSLRSSLPLDTNGLSSRDQVQHQPQIQPTKLTHISELDEITAAHFHTTKSAGLGISGRHLPLLYRLISNLICPPHLYAILVIDIEGRFDATRLTCSPSHLQHVYVHRPARSDPEHTRVLVAEAEGILLYGSVAQASAGREWWGTIVVGGVGAGDIAAGWKGWLRVDRENVRGFAPGVSAEEALDQKKQRQDIVDAAGWVATSQWGGFIFKEADEKILEEDADPEEALDNDERDENTRD
ncbi:uncharacterized protein BKA55DRAFT_538299 [Fusarium redolens]|uniref:Uncharacterized protein n=1 Tax=Fusarium redolens TaxID=48865 RepID=A0A9P9HE92_FUSRE|nr:uncharacterized protein BKA55DRAFT_538299 [Fusarium redolens]KAH7255933.1 hypothetical protein BKA55DRAFT_538299 [Fusarium redolens]